MSVLNELRRWGTPVVAILATVLIAVVLVTPGKGRTQSRRPVRRDTPSSGASASSTVGSSTIGASSGASAPSTVRARQARRAEPSRGETFVALVLWLIVAGLTVGGFHLWKRSQSLELDGDRLDKLLRDLDKEVGALSAEIPIVGRNISETATLRLQVAELASQARDLRLTLGRIEENSQRVPTGVSTGVSTGMLGASAQWMPLRLYGNVAIAAGQRPECAIQSERIYLRGAVRLSPQQAPNVIFAELPIGMRPTADKRYPAMADDVPVRLQIAGSSGQLAVHAKIAQGVELLSLDGVSFERGSLFER